MKKLNIILLVIFAVLLSANVITFALLHDKNKGVQIPPQESGIIGDTPAESGMITREIPVTPLPVQLMAREGNNWTENFNSPVIEITGNGTYSGIIPVSGAYTIFPMIAISAVGTTMEDRILDNAVTAPPEYVNATVTINSVTVNVASLTLTNNIDVLLVPDDGPLVGYANVQIWNAWYQPNQRVVTGDNVSVHQGSGSFLEFPAPVDSIEINFTVSGVGEAYDGVPVTQETVVTEPPVPATAPPPTAVDITGDFNISLTAEQLVRDITIGWNLGNTLDAYHSDDPSTPIHWVNHDNMVEVETAWIGGAEYVTTQALISRVKQAGFNAIRIPVTWYKMAGDAPDYIIREDWLDHVQSIVNMAVAEDMYIVLNTHHDEYVTRFNQDAAVGEQAVTALWTQIAERFKDYNEKLIFEGLNEPRRRNNSWNVQGQWDWSGDSDSFATLNRWNQAFVNAVRATGGNNRYRHLMMPTYAAQGHEGPLNGFVLPADPVAGNGISRFILSVHIYSPHNWAHDGRATYGGEQAIMLDLDRVALRAAALGVPVILGEFGSVVRNSHDLRVQHAADYVSIATAMRNQPVNPVVMACFWWDDRGSFALVDRTAPINENGMEIIQAMVRARNEN
jgi:endoglucanase